MKWKQNTVLQFAPFLRHFWCQYLNDKFFLSQPLLWLAQNQVKILISLTPIVLFLAKCSTSLDGDAVTLLFVEFEARGHLCLIRALRKWSAQNRQTQWGRGINAGALWQAKKGEGESYPHPKFQTVNKLWETFLLVGQFLSRNARQKISFSRNSGVKLKLRAAKNCNSVRPSTFSNAQRRCSETNNNLTHSTTAW